MGKYSIDKLPSEILKEVALNLKRIRKEAKFSQTGLAERADVSLGSLKRFESTGQISLESLLKLMFVLNRLSEFETILQPSKLSEIEALFNDNKKHL